MIRTRNSPGSATTGKRPTRMNQRENGGRSSLGRGMSMQFPAGRPYVRHVKATSSSTSAAATAPGPQPLMCGEYPSSQRRDNDIRSKACSKRSACRQMEGHQRQPYLAPSRKHRTVADYTSVSARRPVPVSARLNGRRYRTARGQRQTRN